MQTLYMLLQYVLLFTIPFTSTQNGIKNRPSAPDSVEKYPHSYCTIQEKDD